MLPIAFVEKTGFTHLLQFTEPH